MAVSSTIIEAKNLCAKSYRWEGDESGADDAKNTQEHFRGDRTRSNVPVPYCCHRYLASKTKENELR